MKEGENDPRVTAGDPFLLGDARIDPSGLTIERLGSTQRVEANVMEVLLALAGRPGRVVSRQELEQEAWPGRIVTDHAVTNAVGKPRRALDGNPRQPRLIETIAKRGYRLKVEPRPLSEDTTAHRPTERKGASRQPWQRGWLFAGALLFAAVALIATWFWRSPADTTSLDLEKETAASVAVMPFDVLGDDPSQAYFAEGISLDLITELSRIPSLLVIAPGTVFGFRGTTADDRTIASKLGVRYLIRGAVQRIGKQVRINILLLEADSGQTLWAERFAGDAGSLFQIQDEVVEGIARGLPVTLDLSGRVTRDRATHSIAAYDEFLKGRERYGRLTPEDNRVAREHFERAVSLDPEFAPAYAGLTLAWSRLALDGWTDDAHGAVSTVACRQRSGMPNLRPRLILRSLKSISCRRRWRFSAANTRRRPQRRPV